jgi:hypothetical protein
MSFAVDGGPHSALTGVMSRAAALDGCCKALNPSY